MVWQKRVTASAPSLQMPRDRTHSGQGFLWLFKALGFRVTAVHLHQYMWKQCSLLFWGSRGISFKMTWLSAWVFGRLSHRRGSQQNMGSTVRPQSSYVRLAPQYYFGIELY
ncbi:hypothetical protein TNCV_4287401 [Trichonephila clavipes]|uniref:Uncharacterized protein n=1 Tax=Trichonephila clavipes TaxID=2585209 RepID=A0A8X6VCR4_TRICX|nr:hypothetical protein TNCV_4287401 [Trichonephila clavipes]